MLSVIIPSAIVNSVFITATASTLPITAIAAVAAISICATATNVRGVRQSDLD